MPTAYLSAYTAKLVAFAKANGYQITDIYDDDPKLPARLATFEAEIAKKPNIYIGCGHGNSNLFTGQDMELLLKKGVNDDACAGVKTYLISCLTAKELGPALVQQGTPEFYGYREDFTFIYHPDYETKPLEDPYARAFFDSGLATGYALILGKKPQDVYNLTIERYDYWWDYWMKQEDPMADDILTWINWDRRNFVGLIPGEEPMVQSAAIQLPSFMLPLGAAGILLFLLSRT